MIKQEVQAKQTEEKLVQNVVQFAEKLYGVLEANGYVSQVFGLRVDQEAFWEAFCVLCD